MRTEIERHSDIAVGKLLRCVDRRLRTHNNGAIRDDAAPSDLPRANARILHAAVIAPLAGVVHIGLALFQQAAMARERVKALLAGDADFGLLLDAFFTVGPFDREP